MGATKEQWNYGGGERVWVGKYKNSQNTLHWHNDCELIYVDGGTLEVMCDGTLYRITTGQAMFIAGESLHRINAVSPDALLTTVIFDSRIINDYGSIYALVSPVLSRDYGIPAIYSELMRELTEKPPLYTYRTAAMINTLMLDIFRNEQTQPETPKKHKADAKLKALFARIQAEYDTITLGLAADFMGMNASYLSRFFAEHTGMHFMRYVNGVRVEHAVKMLSDGEDTVTEIAAKCGFDTIRNFNRIFKLLTGYSPTSIPQDYVFSAAAEERVSIDTDPTLFGCELVECSSTH